MAANLEVEVPDIHLEAEDEVLSLDAEICSDLLDGALCCVCSLIVDEEIHRDLGEKSTVPVFAVGLDYNVKPSEGNQVLDAITGVIDVNTRIGGRRKPCVAQGLDEVLLMRFLIVAEDIANQHCTSLAQIEYVDALGA